MPKVKKNIIMCFVKFLDKHYNISQLPSHSNDVQSKKESNPSKKQ